MNKQEFLIRYKRLNELDYAFIDSDLDLVIKDKLLDFINWHNENTGTYISNSELGRYLNQKP